MDYWRRPEWRDGFNGPFNGQESRRELFLALIERLRIEAIVETGSYRGTTSEYAHRVTGLPVFTVELDVGAYGFCLSRFLGRRGIHLSLGDSRRFLDDLARDGRVEGRVFFYLDAHWRADLPLREEVEIVLHGWPQAVVMIDDFRVPFDEGYGYDDYGDGRALSLEYLGDLTSLSARGFFPATPAASETGARRGALILARDEAVVAELHREPRLRRAEP
jgi:hypothetical protein